MRICVFLPRVLPQLPISPITQVVNHFHHNYRVGIATIAAACARGHEVQCILVGPDPQPGSLTPTTANDITIEEENEVDPVFRHLLDAFGKEAGLLKVALASGPSKSEIDLDGFIDQRSDLFGITHWVTNLNSLVQPGNHVIIDGIGSECAGALKYALGDPKYNHGVTSRGVPVSWSNRDFPTAEGLVKSLGQIHASHKLVASLSSAEATLNRAPDSSVIPSSVRDASKVSLPRELQWASPEERTKQLKKIKDLEDQQNVHIDESTFKDFPDTPLILSLMSWRNLDIAPWFRKRVLMLPQYDGGNDSEMCIAAVEDSYSYFQEMFRQKAFEDYSFLGLPPLIDPSFAQNTKDCTNGQELHRHYFTRLSDSVMDLTREVLPVHVFRGLGIADEKILTRLLGWQLANSDRFGYTIPISADTIADTIVKECEEYVENDAQCKNTLLNFRGSLEEKREKEKKEGGGLKLGSKIRFSMSYDIGEDEVKEFNIPRYWNPLWLNRKAVAFEKMYTHIEWKNMGNKMSAAEDDEDDD